MLNANDTQINLEEWFSENKGFWLRNKQGDSCYGDEKESFRRAFEWDLIEMFKFNSNQLHEYGVPKGDILDVDTCINFFKSRCMDLYGKEWQKHWETYGLKGE